MDEFYVPNVHQCYVPEAKILDYLLNLSHPDGQAKAKFFLSFGFKVDDWQVFRIALENHAINNITVEIEETAFGKKYLVKGILQTPDDRNPHIRTIWFIDKNDEEQIPRLVTAYPLKELDDYD